MKIFFLKLMNGLLKAALRLRYRILIKNFEALQKLKGDQKPILFLPNHPAEVDPIILFTELFQPFFPRGLVVEYFYHMPGARAIFKALRAIPMPDFDVSVTEWKKRRGEKAYQQILEGLKKKENFLIYPSGQLKRTSREKIGGSSMVHRLLNEVKDVNVVLVRIDGLWGSSFSRGITGTVEPFWKLVLNGIKVVLKNGIFFVPKRSVTVEYVINPVGFNPNQTKVQFNRFLEKFYNHYQSEEGHPVHEEPVRLVSYSFWKKDIPQLNYRSQHESKFDGPVTISHQEQEAIKAHLRTLIDDPDRIIHDNDHLSHQLGLDSLDIASVYATVCKMHDIHLKIEPGDIRTVRDLFYIASQQSASPEARYFVREGAWYERPQRKVPHIAMEKSIGASFIKKAKELPACVACKDETTPPITYQKLLITALVLKEKFQEFEEDKIAVLLPASTGVYAIILGLYLAKKTPVMINWTVGSRALEHARDLIGFRQVLTSEKFLDRAAHLDIAPIENQIVLMEDIRRDIGLKDKLKALAVSRLSADGIIRHLGLDTVDPQSPAVVLFTSGTEASPKAVPLSHFNILSNLQAAHDQIALESSDILYGTLPPFHSFGFSVTGLFPLIAGIQVFFAPDPTDAAQMANAIEEYQPTMICLAPSFYKNLFKIAKKGQLNSIRLFVSGAEKAPQELIDAIRALGPEHHFLEGYGITECSPVVSIHRKDRQSRGVGFPLPNLKIKVIHPESGQEIDPSQDGEICISGPSVFNGYIGDGKKDPFIMLDGDRYYRSGDIGHIDPETSDLILSGRLKRFVKIGGEMVSLLAIETALQERFSLSSAPAIFVVSPLEADDEKTKLAVMTNSQASKEELNTCLKEVGFGRIVKIAHVIHREKIPVMGTGKIDYRSIDAQVKNDILEN
jgi:long-chain-fatty-acid--[acyl-carrier-protein] ligase